MGDSYHGILCNCFTEWSKFNTLFKERCPRLMVKLKSRDTTVYNEPFMLKKKGHMCLYTHIHVYIQNVFWKDGKNFNQYLGETPKGGRVGSLKLSTSLLSKFFHD